MLVAFHMLPVDWTSKMWKFIFKVPSALYSVSDLQAMSPGPLKIPVPQRARNIVQSTRNLEDQFPRLNQKTNMKYKTNNTTTRTSSKHEHRANRTTNKQQQTNNKQPKQHGNALPKFSKLVLCSSVVFWRLQWCLTVFMLLDAGRLPHVTGWLNR